jgi:hypothetical protein
MIWLGLIIGVVASAPLGYLLGRRAAKTKKVEKKKSLSFDEMMVKAWKSPKHDPDLAAQVDADIEDQLKD